jgi:hypothetical protein
MSDTRTTERWSVVEREWLDGVAVAWGCSAAGVVQRVVRAEMARGARSARESGSVVPSAGGVGTVAAGAAPVSPSGAAPARGSRLDVVVARLLSGGVGPIPPAAVARARRLVSGGGVLVGGEVAVDPAVLVSPGEVVLR